MTTISAMSTATKESIDLMAHLMRRAGFGAQYDELEARAAKGYEATVEELFRTVHAHPTLPEGLMEAAHGGFGQPIHLPPQRKRRAK
mgnify:CR=1 FL=1